MPPILCPVKRETPAAALSRRSFLLRAGFLSGAVSGVASLPFRLIGQDTKKAPQQQQMQSPVAPARDTLDNYVYTAPSGWTTARYPDGIVLSSNNGESCRLTLWPMRSTGSNLANDASRLFADVFG